MQLRWCALYRIILNKVTTSIVFRCMSTQRNGKQGYHTLGYFYERAGLYAEFYKEGGGGGAGASSVRGSTRRQCLKKNLRGARLTQGGANHPECTYTKLDLLL